MADYTVPMPDGKLKKYVDVSNGTGTAYAEAQALQVARGTTIHHRTAVGAVDKLLPPTTPSGADVATGGSLLAGTTYNFNVAAANRYGPTTVPSAGTRLTAADASNTHVVRITVAQIANAEYYEIFLSVDAAPKWVTRITEAQRALGCTVTGLGAVSATTPGVGLVDVQVPGTGVATTAAPFTSNNAYTPQLVTPLVLPAGYINWDFQYTLNVTDLRVSPLTALVLFKQNPTTSDWGFIGVMNPNFLTANMKPLVQAGTINAQGANMVVLLDALTGTGATVDIYATPISPP